MKGIPEKERKSRENENKHMVGKWLHVTVCQSAYLGFPFPVLSQQKRDHCDHPRQEQYHNAIWWRASYRLQLSTKS